MSDYNVCYLFSYCSETFTNSSSLGFLEWREKKGKLVGGSGKVIHGSLFEFQILLLVKSRVCAN